MVTPEEFDTLNQDKLQYNYSWKYEQEPADEMEEKEISEDLMEDDWQDCIVGILCAEIYESGDYIYR